MGLGERSRAQRVALFHHDPARTDEQVEAMARSLSNRCLEIVVAREGLSLQLPAAGDG